ncbi:o-succinylbenzoate synthase [Effusibacillus dendaii]|uniref:o-succinylbenzoate synthase n=1 Tax=Effusibacillus dendaii TaxID=2743772 RepID=A0A7I8DBU8_9BACL|nr:o-succinylbenzoate synthase [Effusibacillus dendaii]BCJ86316.1 o-succinylbenzoate synthase [Effusibacillus dendaii]
MLVDRIVLRKVRMQLKTPFVSSQGAEHQRTVLIVEAYLGDRIGYGEIPVLSAPYYNEETVGTVWHVAESFLVPVLFQTDWQTPIDVADAFRHVRRNYMAKSGLEAAVWDLYAQLYGVSMAEALNGVRQIQTPSGPGGKRQEGMAQQETGGQQETVGPQETPGGLRTRVEAGVSIGIQPDTKTLLKLIEGYLSEGYRRIKIKIQPDWDEIPLRAIRQAFGPVPLMADANSAYTLADVDRLRRLDEFGLMMIEQPLAHDDIIDHAKLQRVIDTPICLDESIVSAEDGRRAAELCSCKIINIKPSRVGGPTEAVRLHDICRANGIPVWCGGMFESGIGRAFNIALAALPNFCLPGDISASNRYWQEDIIEPEIVMETDGTIGVPAVAGMGFAVKRELLDRLTIEKKEYER